MDENICKFVQTKNVMDSINILNFVYEKKADFKQSFIIPASHALHLVTAGEGILHTSYGDFKIKNGDLFFTFSTKPYYIENKSELQYIYISFIGLRTSGLFERMRISYTLPVYNDFSFLCERWLSDFNNANESNIDLVCEGLLLHSLSFLCQSIDEPNQSGRVNDILSIKQYMDMHYTESCLNLKSVSRLYKYTPKYVSSAFVKLVKIPFTKYLRDLRMKHARSLLNGGMYNIRDVAAACGYSDAFYFSKVFKKCYGTFPKNYAKESRAAAPDEK